MHDYSQCSNFAKMGLLANNTAWNCLHRLYVYDKILSQAFITFVEAIPFSFQFSMYFMFEWAPWNQGSHRNKYNRKVIRLIVTININRMAHNRKSSRRIWADSLLHLSIRSSSKLKVSFPYEKHWNTFTIVAIDFVTSIENPSIFTLHKGQVTSLIQGRLTSLMAHPLQIRCWHGRQAIKSTLAESKHTGHSPSSFGTEMRTDACSSVIVICALPVNQIIENKTKKRKQLILPRAF